jgi:hypothetical protein
MTEKDDGRHVRLQQTAVPVPASSKAQDYNSGQGLLGGVTWL